MKNLLTFTIALAVLSGGSVFLSGCQEPAPPPAPLTKLSGGTMGTFYEVTIAGDLSETEQQELQTDIEETLAEVNRQMSTYDPESEISHFNRSESTDWFDVSPGFAQVAKEALAIAEATNGLFDPTVGPLIDLWRFGPEKDITDLPTAEEIAAAREHVGFDKLEVRLDPPAIRKSDPKTKLDLSAIAKGYGVDEVSWTIQRLRHENFLVNIGGEILAHGFRKTGEPWRLAIEKPVADSREIQSLVPLSDQAMATSGDYRNFYELDGKRISHTINPTTGQPVTHLLHSVSVIAEDCMTADGMATALLVMGPEAAWAFAEKHELLVYLAYTENDKLKTHSSPDFPLQPFENE